MKLGLYLNLYGRTDEGQMSEIVEQAQLAEQAGFDWVVLGERHLYRPAYHEVLTTMAYLAAKTDRIGIATAGVIVPLYDPALLAEQTAHIDVLSSGRLSLGVVLGYRPEEFDLYGVPIKQRVGRFEENVALIKRLWRGETVSHQGRYHSLNEAYIAPTPTQTPRPRIWNGARVDAALERTARLCDGWTTSFNETRANLPARIKLYRDAPAGDDTLGREVIVCREGYSAPTVEAARRALEGPLSELYSAYTGWKRTSVDQARYTDPWDEIVDRSVIGTPEQCLSALNDYTEMGADGAILRIQAPGMPHADAMAAIGSFGESVIPSL